MYNLHLNRVYIRTKAHKRFNLKTRPFLIKKRHLLCIPVAIVLVALIAVALPSLVALRKDYRQSTRILLSTAKRSR